MEIHILLVEDNAAAARLTRVLMKENKILEQAELHHVIDGSEAIRFLKKSGPYAEAPSPDLILLDLHLAGMDGGQFLTRVKADPDLKHVPVVVLTTSSLRQDILKVYQLQANGCVRKPFDLSEFRRVIQAIADFWFVAATLPGQPDACSDFNPGVKRTPS